jgi:hypothetical protein
VCGEVPLHGRGALYAYVGCLWNVCELIFLNALLEIIFISVNTIVVYSVTADSI